MTMIRRAGLIHLFPDPLGITKMIIQSVNTEFKEMFMALESSSKFYTLHLYTFRPQQHKSLVSLLQKPGFPMSLFTSFPQIKK